MDYDHLQLMKTNEFLLNVRRSWVVMMRGSVDFGDKLNDREGQSAYTYSSHLVVTSALYIYVYRPSVIEILGYIERLFSPRKTMFVYMFTVCLPLSVIQIIYGLSGWFPADF